MIRNMDDEMRDVFSRRLAGMLQLACMQLVDLAVSERELVRLINSELTAIVSLGVLKYEIH